MKNAYFHYPEIRLGRVYGVYAPNLTPKNFGGTPLVVDQLPYSYSGPQSQVPVAMPYGFIRLPRKNQASVTGYVEGVAQVPVALGMHVFNVNPIGSGFEDPLPTDVYGAQIFSQADDFVLYHHETSAYMRWRNTATGDGQPCQWDIQFRSGAHVQIKETSQTQATLSVTMPSGASITIDAAGNVNVTAAGNATITAPSGKNVLLGDNAATHKLLLDVYGTSLKTYIDAHVHTGVATGAGSSGPPATPSPTVQTTTKTLAD